MKKIRVGIVVCMLVSTSTLVFVSTTAEAKTTPLPLNTGDIFYVGGAGPNNYTKIQDAINDAGEGDTVFVYDDSSPYYENLRINQSISLIGEDKQTTIIDGGHSENVSVIDISAKDVVIQYFSIQYGSTGWPNEGNGIEVKADNVLITDNIIKENFIGIVLGGWNNNTVAVNHCVVEGNDIYENIEFGIYLVYANDSNISYNLISSNKYGGIYIRTSTGNLIAHNNIIENGNGGILVDYASNNIIQKNNITGNQGGIYLTESNMNSILQNNLYKNGLSNSRIDSVMFISIVTKSRPFHNTWDGNYWGRARQLPRPIFGFSLFFFPSVLLSMALQPFKHGNDFYLLVPLGLIMVKFDWHPAQQPYDIS